jgi:hypothetical protein
MEVTEAGKPSRLSVVVLESEVRVMEYALGDGLLMIGCCVELVSVDILSHALNASGYRAD